jgi:hypothetical protein
MISWLKKYWIEVLVIGIIFAIMMVDLSPDLTWMNVDSDGAEYVMDSIYFYPAHHTSAPLYLLTGHLFEMLPFGTIYWRMSFMSALFTLGSMIFLYFIVSFLLKDNNRKRFYALLAVTIFGGSALAISQAVIVETYAVVTFFSIGAYYFVIKKKWLWASAFIGMGVVTHHLIFLTWAVLFVFHKELRPFVLKDSFPFIKITNIKPFLMTCGFLIFYIYMPLSKAFTDQPNMWGNTTFSSFFTNNISVFTMLIGQLPIYELPKRIFDALGVMGISLGIGLPLILWWVFKIKTWKNELLWLFVLPIAWYIGNMAPQVAKYCEASVAWGAIIIVLFLAKYGWKWALPVWLSAITLLGVNGNYWDIGRTIDPNLSATQFYEKEIPKMKDGDIFITQGAWEWIEIFLYNKQHDRHIETICMGILASSDYQQMLLDKGIKLTDYDIGDSQASNELNKKQVYVAMSIVEQNDNVWTSRPTDPPTYGAEVVPAKGNTEHIEKWLGSANVIPQWKFQPSNPYDIITGSIEVSSWNFVLQSNKTVMWLCVYTGVPFILVMLVLKKVFKRNNDGKKTKSILDWLKKN